MLVDFKCDNFRLFRDGFDFSMESYNRLSELKYSILKEKIDGKDEKVLSTSVIYGPNAAGKTSVINAISCFKTIIMNGSIADDPYALTDHVSHQKNLIPFNGTNEIKPITFDITFIFKKKKYRYCLSFYVGKFLDVNFDRYIDSEKLYVDDKIVFERNSKEVTVLNIKNISAYLNYGCDKKTLNNIKHVMSHNIKSTKLTLTTDFYSFCSKSMVENMKMWFSNQLMVYDNAKNAEFYPIQEKGTSLEIPYVNDMANRVGSYNTSLAYRRDEDTGLPMLVSVLKTRKDGNHDVINADVYESMGTMRLIKIMPAILMALSDGKTLILDEFDVSLHPKIIANVISIFHNDEVNKNNAQLIFNTHNPIYLNNKLFRRDEIKFVERDDETGISSLYALSDFKANDGTTSVRNTTDYMKNYFIDRYGAIVDVDFTDLILDILSQEDEKND